MVRSNNPRESKEAIIDDPTLQRSLELETGTTIEADVGGRSITIERPHDHIEVAIEPQKKGASLQSSVLNLVNTTVGAGILSLPSSYAKIGIVLGLLLTALFAFFCWYSIWLLARAADQVIEDTLKKNKTISEREIRVDFKWVAKQIAPWTGYANNFFIFLFAVGLLICYLIVVGDAFPTVIKVNSNSDGETWYDVLTTRQVWIAIVWVVCVPLAFFRKLDSLRFVSFVAFPCMCYLAGYLFIYLCIKGTNGELDAWPSSVGGINCISVFAFAFACHLNYYTVYNEYKPADRKRYASKSGVIASVIVCIIYVFSGLCGYLTCGKDVDGNVINSLSKNAASTIGRIAVGIAVCFSYPLMFNPCRGSLMLCLEKFDFFKYQSPKTAKITYVVITSLLLAISLLSLAINSVDTVLNFLGCLAAPISSFIVPAYYYYKVYKDREGYKVQTICALVYTVFGFLLMIVGFILQILNLTHVLD